MSEVCFTCLNNVRSFFFSLKRYKKLIFPRSVIGGSKCEVEGVSRVSTLHVLAYKRRITILRVTGCIWACDGKASSRLIGPVNSYDFVTLFTECQSLISFLSLSFLILSGGSTNGCIYECGLNYRRSR